MKKRQVKQIFRSIVSLVMAIAMIVTSQIPVTKVSAQDTEPLKGMFRIYSIQDSTQRMAPGGDMASEGNSLWLWEQGASAPADAEIFYFEKQDDFYYWYSKQSADLVMQAESNAVSIQKKDEDNEQQKWTIEKVEGTEDQYYLKNGERYVSSATDYHAQITMSETPKAWRLEKVESEFSVQLSASVTKTGDSVTVQANGTDENGDLIDTKKVNWTSSDQDIAAISGNTVYAKKEGTVTITGEYQGVSADASLTVLKSAEEYPGIYRIDSALFDGYLLEPGADSVTAGNYLYLWNTSVQTSRMWVFTDAGDGYVYWHPKNDLGLVLEGTDLGKNPSLQNKADTDAQKWKFVPDGESGTVRIQNKATENYIGTHGDGNQQLVEMVPENALSSLWYINELQATVKLELDANNIQTGKTATANVIAKDASGAAITSGITVKSSDESVASVKGMTITGLKEGNSNITAVVSVGEKEYVSSPIRLSVTDESPEFTGREWYKDIVTAEVNREPSHADFVPYQDASTAVESEKSALDDKDESESDYYQLLSQKEWDFALVRNPEEADQADAKGYLDETLPQEAKKDFQKEFVPQAWQTYRNEDGTFKYFDEPIYTNSIYPWGSVPGNTIEYDDPQAPTYYNPVGYYRTEFETPKDWDGREIFVSFQAVKSAYYLYVNGKQVGYTTDSFTAHDFNITPYLHKNGEKNTIALKVYRWSIGSYLENQDYIQQSGIFRDVYLYSKDKHAEIRDFFVQTKFADRTDKNSDVTMTVDVDVRNLTQETVNDEYTVDVTLLNESGKAVAKDTLTYNGLKGLQGKSSAINPDAQPKDGEKKVNLGERKTAVMEVKNPEKWFPDTPNLYMITLELKDKNGDVVEAVADHVGFREIYKVNINEDEQEQMQITGQKIIFRGVNRHDSDLETGRAVSRQDIIDDMKLMKQFNVNAVRTSHYPNDKLLYDIADELGIFVYAEANVESHYGAYADHATPIPGADSRWVTPVVDRNMNMVELLKNHASVIGWSFANEATYTHINYDDNYCFWAASMAVLERDPSRLRMYERESDGYNGHRYQKEKGADPWSMETRRNNLVDVHSTQYPQATDVENYAKNPDYKLPYFEQEYEHAMGQAFGSFNEFWDLNRTYPNVQGGFIWDWIDQSIDTKREGRESFWGYGGDWIDQYSNADAFCGNGLFFADRTPTAKAVQMRYDHQQINFYLENENATVVDGVIPVKVVNEYENTDLSQFNILWTLTKDDKTVKSGKLDLSTPGMKGDVFGEEIVNIELPDIVPKTGDVYMLEFSAQNKVKPDWDATTVKYDNVVAHQQFDLTVDENAKNPLKYQDMNTFTKVEVAQNVLTIEGRTEEGKTYSLKMDKVTGILKDYSVDGKVVLEKGPVPSFWRAQTYNDTPVKYDSNLRNEEDNMELLETPVVKKEDNNKHIRVELKVKLSMDADEIMTYDIYGNGEIVVNSAFTPRSNFAPGNEAGNYALPKVGVRMTVAPGYENLEYFGRGPEENYVDRKTSTDVGVYKSTVTEQFMYKYLKPQENGNHTDVRWTSLTNDEGNGLMITADGTMETSALHVKAENLNPSSDEYPYNSQAIRHSTEVPMDAETYLCVDTMQRGVSNTAFFNHMPLEGFYPTTKPDAEGNYPTYEKQFRITPVTEDTDKMEESKNGFAPMISTTILEYAVELASTADTTGVITSVKEKFDAALVNAKDILEKIENGDTMITQTMVDHAWQELIKLMQYLSFKQGDKEDLEKVIALAETMETNMDTYLDEGKEQFMDALVTARNVYADGDAMQDEVNSAWKNLLKAMANLQLKPDKGLLEELVARAEGLKAEDYKVDGYEVMSKKLASAKAVLEDENATQDMVDTIALELETALEKLALNDGTKQKETVVASAGTEEETTAITRPDNSKSAQNVSAEKSVKTGDKADAALRITVMFAALVTVAVISRKRRKYEMPEEKRNGR